MSLKGTLTNRRGFLVSVGVGVCGGLAGCLSDGNDAGTPTTTQNDRSATPETDTPEQVVKTAPSDDAPMTTSTETSTTSTPSEPVSPPLRSESGTTSYGIGLAGNPIIANTSDPTVDIYYWSDYQCAYCKQFEMGDNGALPKLIRNEVSDGVARIVLLHYPNYGDHSWTADVMATCLWNRVKDDRPDRFWEWHRTVFENQQLDGGEWSSRSNLLGYARDIDGIDANALDQCMKQNRKQHEAKIKQERKRARNEGFSDTPGFVLYHSGSDQTTSFFGAQPYSTFKQQIDAYRNL
ncbi:DsbA family protein [Halocatena pleomorpha]|uniref:Disulfide bond formation protein DsbA n=1 Tax=Halocatena pleomorpha TaxID=1785090 RepID=A0A3P3R579_9EURY|nr:thioredoxin domain-containing protein [Halocatena pleomorpha]RRJ28039.1 disulfide bond formation protein DsbA [Halocatena pleomorpha]